MGNTSRNFESMLLAVFSASQEGARITGNKLKARGRRRKRKQFRDNREGSREGWKDAALKVVFYDEANDGYNREKAENTVEEGREARKRWAGRAERRRAKRDRDVIIRVR